MEFQLCGTDDVWLRLCQNGVTWQPTKTYQRAQTSYTQPSHSPNTLSHTQTDTCACAHPLISPPNGLSNSGSQPNLPHVTHTQSRKGVAAAVCGSGGVVCGVGVGGHPTVLSAVRKGCHKHANFTRQPPGSGKLF